MGEVLTQSEKFERWRAHWTPEAIAAREVAAAAERRAERERAAEPVALTLGALLAKVDFTRDYAEHLMQSYCTCGHGHDGWEYCQHARDLGWPERDSGYQATAL